MRGLGRVPIVALSVVTLAACAQHAGGGSRPGPVGEWPADRTFLSTSVSQGGKDRPLVAGTRITLQFQRAGGLSAQAGCNHLGGSGRLDGDVLVLGDLAMTEMACDADRMAQDSWLAEFLTAGPTWSLTGDDLVLRRGDVQIRFTDREAVDPDRPLVGTRWVVDTIITGDAASSVPSGVEAYLYFDSATHYRGSTGCAGVGGTVQLRGEKILFPAVSPAPRSCTDEKAALDHAVTATLFGAVTYRMEGPHLTLTGPSGNGLRLTAVA
jgi:heat shock protein HslJ